MNTQANNPFASTAVTERAAGAVVAVEQQRAIAEVQAALTIAMRNPRDPARAMDLILQDCTRPSLAESSVYEYSRGGTSISGPSIRLAEVLARRWGNIECGVRELSRRDGFSECQAYAWDLETNYRDSKVFQVKHWRDTKNGGYAITDERDIYELVANQGARRKRACILSVIPPDVAEEATRQCEITIRTKTEVTPERIQAMRETFAGYGVTVAMIEKRIQRHLDSITPALLVQLGKIANSLADGMSEPSQWFEVSPAAAGDPAPGPATGAAALKEAVKRRGRPPKQETPPAPPADPGSSASLLDDVKRICAEAVGIPDRSAALDRLDDAKFLTIEMVSLPDRDAAHALIKSSMETIAARVTADPSE